MPLTIRQRRQRVADYIQTHAASTIATIAEATGLHPSSVYRHRQGLSCRQQYPESSWWETAVGYGWLVRLVIAVVYHFGIKHSVGAESLSAFFQSDSPGETGGVFPHHPAAAQTSGGGRDGRL